jgi:hypothetical protein
VLLVPEHGLPQLEVSKGRPCHTEKGGVLRPSPREIPGEQPKHSKQTAAQRKHMKEGKVGKHGDKEEKQVEKKETPVQLVIAIPAVEKTLEPASHILPSPSHIK